MRYFSYLVAIVTIAALALAGSAQARDHGRGDGWKKGRPSMQRPAKPRGFGEKVERRQVKQRARIRDGRRNGALNGEETRRLRKQQRRITRMDRRFSADGRYSPRERRIMNHALDRSSKRIWRKKHNDHYGSRGFDGKHHYRRHDRPGWKRDYRRHYSPEWKRYIRRHHSRYLQPVRSTYEPADSFSQSLDVEFDGIRFSWSESG